MNVLPGIGAMAVPLEMAACELAFRKESFGQVTSKGTSVPELPGRSEK